MVVPLNENCRMPSFDKTFMNSSINRVCEYQHSGRLNSYESRRQNLLSLRSFIVEEEDVIIQALYEDLHKPKSEAIVMEIALSLASLDHALANLKNWMAPRAVSSPVVALPATTHIQMQPLGVVLLIGPFNYPCQLILRPLVDILAAGNAVVIKPSELSSTMSAVFAKVLPKYISENIISIIEGGIDVSSYLLSRPFDHIMFTGSKHVAKFVLKAAAEHLTPTTLELGGTCPAIVMPSANISVTAKRIMWSKWVNAGQTCVAVNHVLIHENCVDYFIRECIRFIHEFSEAKNPKASNHFGRIISTKHTRRLKSLISQCQDDGAKIIYGGMVDVEKRYVEPTIITNIGINDCLMNEEIFGPILPIIVVQSLCEAIVIVRHSLDKPLANYVFSSDANEIQRVENETTSGALCINDAIFHGTCMEIPFGGVGGSGMGSYVGKSGFDNFSHSRGVMQKYFWFDLPQRYPPISRASLRVMKMAIKMNWLSSTKIISFLSLAFSLIMTALIFRHFGRDKISELLESLCAIANLWRNTNN